ncbi:MAG: hypothetical protein AAGF07_04125 [Patescibacteria group bacterium]
MSVKKIESALNLIEIAENNLKTAKTLLLQLSGDRAVRAPSADTQRMYPGTRSSEESTALEVVEGYFEGESMIGDNGKTYLVPQNYASKTQLVVGDRMKWILTPEREVFKLIQPVNRERVTGTFAIEGDNFVVLVDKFSNPIKILKASATYAIKQLSLKPGDEVAVYIPKDTENPSWGAFINIVKASSNEASVPSTEQSNESIPAELDALNEFKLDDENSKQDTEKDFF